MRWWGVVLLVLVGCDDDEERRLRRCLDPGPVCEGLCPLYEERLATVQDQWDDGDIDGYVSYACGAYRVVTRFADEGQVDNYFGQNGVLVSTALRGGGSAQHGRGCLDEVRWQGPPIDCAPECAFEFSRPPETLVGVPPCEDTCRLDAPVCESVCPSLSQRVEDVRTQFSLGSIDAWFHLICDEYQVVARFDSMGQRTDNYYDGDGVLVSSRLNGDELAEGCSDLTAWQGPVLECEPQCTVEESRHPRELLGIDPCRCRVPEPVCEGLCPTFDARTRTVKTQFERAEIDGYATWRCGDYRVVSRYSDTGQSDNYYADDDTLVATALRGNDPEFGQFCEGDVAWQGTPVQCDAVCAIEASRDPQGLLGVGFCPEPDMGVVDSAVPDAAPQDAGVDAAPDAGACAAEGAAVPVVPDAPQCCAGLAPIGCDRPDGNGMCPGGCEGASICARCGDGMCGLGENTCNCPADCPPPAQCAGEGEAIPVIPNAPECCAGLSPIGCASPDAQGICPPVCAGASICARCGDGACGPGENLCNCPVDCPADGICRSTAACLDHAAPIRCLGAWRCDPADARPSDHQGDDGCNYTCLGNLERCDANAICPEGDRCAPCPVDGQCAGIEVCRAGDDRSCGEVDDCAGLDHDACENGGFACINDRCVEQCP